MLMGQISVPITIQMTDAIAQRLVTGVQPHRLGQGETAMIPVNEADAALVANIRLAEGALILVSGFLEAMLIAAYEQALGYSAVLMSKPGRAPRYAVLTSRSHDQFEG